MILVVEYAYKNHARCPSWRQGRVPAVPEAGRGGTRGHDAALQETRLWAAREATTWQQAAAPMVRVSV